MVRDSFNEHDNDLKRVSRQLISEKVNKHFRDFDKKNIFRVIELLGSGVGYNYYRSRKTGFSFSNKKLFYLIEKDNEKIQDFLKNKNLPGYGLSDFVICNDDLYKFLETKPEEFFDLINLDFCSYYTEKLKYGYSCVDVIKKMFETNVLKKNGMFFTTFLHQGYLIELNKRWHDIITDENEIISNIKKIAKQYNRKIKLISQFSYKSSSNSHGNSVMLNTGFILH